MTNEEMVEKIVSRTGITEEQAKEALEKNNNDLLDAMIYVEKTYSAKKQPEENAAFTANIPNGQPQENPQNNNYAQQPFEQPAFNENKCYGSINGEKIGEYCKKAESVFKKIMDFGFNNHIEVSYNNNTVFTMPVIIPAAMLVLSASTLIWPVVISMFFDVKYSFKSNKLNTVKANLFLNGAYDLIQKIKMSFMG
ncbi:MAG: hypothetical protein II589_07470 [Clostridia bacterium]|nr:hypothetical protein [Clostridia bacterium]